jgi:hypothetical protein
MITMPAGVRKVTVTLFTSTSFMRYYTQVHSDYVVERIAKQIGSAAAEVTFNPLFCCLVVLSGAPRPSAWTTNLMSSYRHVCW